MQTLSGIGLSDVQAVYDAFVTARDTRAGLDVQLRLPRPIVAAKRMSQTQKSRLRQLRIEQRQH